MSQFMYRVRLVSLRAILLLTTACSQPPAMDFEL